MSSTPPNDDKKGNDVGLETSTPTSENSPVVVDPAQYNVDDKKLMRKIDFRLIPWLSVLYLLSFLDRSAIGNAKLYGMAAELNTTDQQFNLATAIFFFPLVV
jgi:hypothetical protein